jgi:hypothetical protein
MIAYESQHSPSGKASSTLFLVAELEDGKEQRRRKTNFCAQNESLVRDVWRLDEDVVENFREDLDHLETSTSPGSEEDFGGDVLGKSLSGPTQAMPTTSAF